VKSYPLQLPSLVSGRELLAAIRTASTEEEYTEVPGYGRTFAGQRSSDIRRNILVSVTPELREDSGINPSQLYRGVWMLSYLWSGEPYGPRYLSAKVTNGPFERFAQRLLEALG